MTAKHVIIIDLKEIPHLEIACAHCGGSITVPIPNHNKVGAIGCTGCNRTLCNPGDRAHSAIVGMLSHLSAWKDAEQSKDVQLRFSIPTKSE